MEKQKQNKFIPRLTSLYYYLRDCILIWLIAVYFVVKQLIEKHRKCSITENRQGHVAIVTGGSGGIGSEIVRKLLSHGFHTIIADCDELNLKKLKDEFPTQKVEYFHIDLTSTKSVRNFAENFLKRNLPLHLLINNAGVMFCPYKLCENGIESQVHINYVSHFLLTYLLLPRLEESGKETLKSRIVNVSSCCHYVGYVRTEDFGSRDYYSAYGSYAQSKLYIVMSTILLQELLNKKNAFVTVNCLHPGVIATQLYKYSIVASLPNLKQLLLKTPEKGADWVVYLAVAKEIEDIGGKYFDNCQIRSPKRLANDRDLQLKVWRKTCQILELNDFDPTL